MNVVKVASIFYFLLMPKKPDKPDGEKDPLAKFEDSFDEAFGLGQYSEPPESEEDNRLTLTKVDVKEDDNRVTLTMVDVRAMAAKQAEVDVNAAPLISDVDSIAELDFESIIIQISDGFETRLLAKLIEMIKWLCEVEELDLEFVEDELSITLSKRADVDYHIAKMEPENLLLLTKLVQVPGIEVIIL